MARGSPAHEIGDGHILTDRCVDDTRAALQPYSFRSVHPYPLMRSAPLPLFLPSSDATERQHQADDHSLSRRTVIAQAYRQLKGVHPSLLRPKPPRGAAPHVALNVSFKGESVLGQGGEWME